MAKKFYQLITKNKIFSIDLRIKKNNMVQDTTLQIFLTIYHGSLLSTFVYDYIIRNICRVLNYGPQWAYVSNIALGIVFVAIIIWTILSVWAKVRRNLLISLFLLVIIFVIRLAVSLNRKIYALIIQWINFVKFD